MDEPHTQNFDIPAKNGSGGNPEPDVLPFKNKIQESLFISFKYYRLLKIEFND